MLTKDLSIEHIFSGVLQGYGSAWGWNGVKKMWEPDTGFSFLIQWPIPLSVTSENWFENLLFSVYLKQWLKLNVQDIKCWPFCCAIAVWQVESSGKTSMNHSGSVRWLLASTGGQVRKHSLAQLLVVAGLTLRNSPEEGWKSLIHKVFSELC